jgi:phage terminase large subunit
VVQAVSATTAPANTVRLRLPRKLAMLREDHPYKVAYGGRASLKSTSFAAALLTEGLERSERILCLREVQKSLVESVHLLLSDQIKKLNYGHLYTVTENAIRANHSDTMFRFTGLSDQTADSMKSFEGFTRFWFEEAQAISKRSFQIALPTLFRTPGAQAWVSFNPDMDTDEVWERFVVNPPPGAAVVEMNWRDAVICGWMSDENERLRQYDLIHSKDDYDNIWDGKPRTVVAGAIYSTEVIEMIKEGRFRPIPYDPRLPVHRIWDLGWNDLMTVIMVQKPHPSALNVINYMEESHITYAGMIAAMDRLGYKWGDDWLPHDAAQHHPTSGTNALKQIRDLSGRTPKDIPKSDPEARIRAARMMFPRVYVDNSKHQTPTDRPDRLVGAAHLMDRLKRYKRTVPRSTNEPAGPTHDIASHGADAWGGLAEIADRIRNEGDRPRVIVPGFRQSDPAMGMLG